MRMPFKAVLSGVVLLLCATTVHAASITYSIEDIGTFAEYSTANVGQTYSGTGFVGMYNFGSFAHLFGLEGSSSEANAQVDLSAVTGSTITSAVLSYSVLVDSNISGAVTITGYQSTGALGYMFNAPASNLGTATGTTFSSNSVDVTSLVAAAVGSGAGYLGLLFQDSVFGNWTYTSAASDGNADAAQVRLTVNYAPAVPEPSSLSMLGLGLAGLGLRRRARSSSSSLENNGAAGQD